MYTDKIKKTKQRDIILSTIRALKTHPNAEEVYEAVKKEYPNLGISTVYRNLELFSKEGLIKKINLNPVRYDGELKTHSHFKCAICGVIEDIFNNFNIDKKISNGIGHKINGYNLEIYGTCKNCLKQGGL